MTVATNVSQEVFAQHHAQWLDAMRKAEIAKAKVRSTLAAAKSAGIDIKAMQRVEAKRHEDPDDAKQRARTDQIYGRWLGIEVYAQPDLFAGEPPPMPAASTSEAFAVEAGFQAGKAGELRTDGNPFPAGTPNYVAWDRGYMDGQAAIAEGMKPGANREKVAGKRGKASNRGSRGADL